MSRLLAALCAGLFAVLPLAGCATDGRPPREAVEHFENGDRAYKANNNSVAESEFAAAVSAAPDYAEAQLQLGYTRYRLKKYEEARRNFAHAAKLYGNNATGQEATFWAGMCDYALGYDAEAKGGLKAAQPHFRNAEASFSNAIRAGYTGNEVFAMRAWMRLSLNELGKAQSDFRRAIKYTSDPAKKKEYQEAVDNINRAFGEPARIAEEKERAAQIDDAQKAAPAITDAVQAYAKAKECFEREQFGPCRVFCRRALELDPKHEEAARLLKLAEEYDWAK
ncbi:MAG TPA: hypothetical protein PLF37_03160 [Planctomycetota bacterium]|nr:hypothetical protein [Planctomycetota bacterium]